MWHFPGFNEDELIMLKSVSSSNKDTMDSLNCQYHKLHILILQQVPAAAETLPLQFFAVDLL